MLPLLNWCEGAAPLLPVHRHIILFIYLFNNMLYTHSAMIWNQSEHDHRTQSKTSVLLRVLRVFLSSDKVDDAFWPNANRLARHFPHPFITRSSSESIMAMGILFLCLHVFYSQSASHHCRCARFFQREYLKQLGCRTPLLSISTKYIQLNSL